MNFLSRLFSKPGPDDQPLAEQHRYIEDWCQGVFESAGVRPGMLPACEELPGAYGTFGFDASNPIPVNGPRGEVIYLNRLRSENGCKFFWHRLGNCDCPFQALKLDAYELVAMDGSAWHTLYFSMYHPSRSTRAPEGLSLASWKRSSQEERIFMTHKGCGSTYFVENFPYGLPAVVTEDEGLNSIGPGFGAVAARILAKTLEENKGKFNRPANPGRGSGVQSFGPGVPIQGISSPANTLPTPALSPATSSPEYRGGTANRLVRFDDAGRAHRLVTFDEDNRATIVHPINADITTMMFAQAIILRRHLNGDELKVAERWAGVEDGIWTDAHEEKFANGNLKYWQEGIPPVPERASDFAPLSERIAEILANRNDPVIEIELNDDMRALFARHFGG